LDGIERRWSGGRDMMQDDGSFKKWWSVTNGNKPYLERKKRNVSVLRREINIQFFTKTEEKKFIGLGFSCMSNFQSK
jgi:hypothetical protein